MTRNADDCPDRCPWGGGNHEATVLPRLGWMASRRLKPLQSSQVQ